MEEQKLHRFVIFSAIAKENMSKIEGYIGRAQQSLILAPEIRENHGYNVINVEEGNHEEIKKRNKCFSALSGFMTTLAETQAGGGQAGTQVAASGWKKVLRFGDGVWPPEPPRGQVPEWVTISDPTVPIPRVNRFVPKQPPGPPPGYKAPPQPYPSPTAPPRSSAAGPGAQSSSSAGPPPQAAPKPAAKSMPSRRDMPETEYVPAQKPLNVVTYSRVWMDYTGMPVRSTLNIHVDTMNEYVTCPGANGEQCSIHVATIPQEGGHVHLPMFWTRKCQGDCADNSYTYSDLEWLRIYNAAVKRGGMLHQNYYLSVGSMTVMVNMNDDLQATDREYVKWKRGLMPGIGGTIEERPLVRKEKDVLAAKFRFGKAILITDLVYKCSSNARGMTNIQYGLDEMGYAITVIDINSFKSVTKAQKFLDAVEHLKRNVMPDVAAEENVTIHFWISFA